MELTYRFSTECLDGFESLDGGPCRPCPRGFFGKYCLRKCYCKMNEKCNHAKGCLKVLPSTEVVTKHDHVEGTSFSAVEPTTEINSKRGSTLSALGPTDEIKGKTGIDDSKIPLPLIIVISTVLLFVCRVLDECMFISHRRSTNECIGFNNAYIDQPPTLGYSSAGWSYYLVLNARCPDDADYVFSKVFNSCFRVHLYNDALGYDNYSRICESEGGELIKIYSDEKQHQLATFLEEEKLQELLRMFFKKYATCPTLYIIDDCSATKELTKEKKDMLSELAFSGRHAEQSVWVISQRYNSVLKDLREQTKWLCMFYTKDRDSFDNCLRENDVIPTLEERQRIKEELKKRNIVN
ncbi:unnamed protein product [Mytilus coruscus]|uniref:Uncharacterized protein n=1 Tax=Mytilus coruscus TaxID=42192 RepID=A0A6J8DCT6_MYTCO|nr:unnamed protein product [Mytilus coruscus]